MDSASALFDLQFALGQGTGSTLLRRELGAWIGEKGHLMCLSRIRCLIYAKVGVQRRSASLVLTWVCAHGLTSLVYLHSSLEVGEIWDATRWSKDMSKRKEVLTGLLGLPHDVGHTSNWPALPKPSVLALTCESTSGSTMVVVDGPRIWTARRSGCYERRRGYEHGIPIPLSLSAYLVSGRRRVCSHGQRSQAASPV